MLARCNCRWHPGDLRCVCVRQLRWNSTLYLLSNSYGSPGVESASFRPGPIDGHVMWVDPLSGNLYLFGGTDFGSEPQSALWRYNITSGFWALLGGVVRP